MKKSISILLLAMLGMTTAFCQETNNVRPVRFMLKGGVSGIIVTNYDINGGVGCQIGGIVEIPLSQQKPWNINIGLNMVNKNTYTSLGSKSFPIANLDDWLLPLENNLLFLQLPVTFSYDFPLGNNALRIQFGGYYSQYLYGRQHGTILSNSIGGIMLDYPAVYGIQINGSRGFEPYIGTICNGGGIIGLGFLFGNFYFGAEVDMMYDYYGMSNLTTTLTASVGYRF